MTTIPAILFLAIPPAPCVMEEVPWFANQRIASFPTASGAVDILALSIQPGIEVSRWCPATGERLWMWSGPVGARIGGAAVCSIADQDADGVRDWALVRAYEGDARVRTPALITIGSGRTGAEIRSTSASDVGPYFSICGVECAPGRFDFVIGCPHALDRRGELLWMRGADLSIVGRTAGPGTQRAFGAFVSQPSADESTIWIGAPLTSGPWSLWSATGSGEFDLSVLVGGKRRPENARWIGDSSRKFGCSVALVPGYGPIREREIVLGASGYPAVGRIARGTPAAWDSAVWMDGPPAMFGNHFGEVVLVVEDYDGDGQRDCIVTDPGFCFDDPASTNGAFVGGVYLAASSEFEPRLIAMGHGDCHFLGLGAIAVGDLDGDGFTEIAVYAGPRGPTNHTYVEVRSVRRYERLRTLDLSTR